MEMYQDGVRVFILPDGAYCDADEAERSPLEIEECPLGYNTCSGHCCFYEED